MVTLVAPNCTNIFIGFGADHNALGLQQLADARPNGSYFYVAEIEKAGLVFGEVIHQMLYTALVNVTIEVQNGEIYNYKTNTWQTTLQIPSIVSEAKKTYHLRSKDSTQVVVHISAQSLVHGDQEATQLNLDDLITHDTEGESVNLTTHMFRQRTQELMFKAHQHNITAQEEKLTTEQHVAHSMAAKTIRKDLVDFCKFMQQYAKENSVEEDDLLNTLLTDLSVVAKTFGSPRAALYTASKCNSQGRQTSNNTNYIDPNDFIWSAAKLRPPWDAQAKCNWYVSRRHFGRRWSVGLADYAENAERFDTGLHDPETNDNDANAYWFKRRVGRT